MRVTYGLTGGLAVVDSDVKAVRREPLSERRTDLGDNLPKLSLVRLAEIKKTCNVLSGNDKGVSIRDREPVTEGDRRWRTDQDSVFCNVAEWTPIVLHITQPITARKSPRSRPQIWSEPRYAVTGRACGNCVAVVLVVVNPQGDDGTHPFGSTIIEAHNACPDIGGVVKEVGILSNPNTPGRISVFFGWEPFMTRDLHFTVNRNDVTIRPTDVINQPTEFFYVCLIPTLEVDPSITIQPAALRIVFVTSTTYNGDLISGADATRTNDVYNFNYQHVTPEIGYAAAEVHCTERAHAAGLPPVRYMAWLGLTAEQYPSFIENDHAQIEIGLVDGTLVAGTLSEFASDTHRVPIDVDEFGNKVASNTAVWTGFGLQNQNPDGIYCQPPSTWEHWTTSEGEWQDTFEDPFSERIIVVTRKINGTIGDLTKSDPQWNNAGPQTCDQPARLYCLQAQ